MPRKPLAELTLEERIRDLGQLAQDVDALEFLEGQIKARVGEAIDQKISELREVVSGR